MNGILYVALGGGLGAASRHLVNLWAQRLMGTAFPYGTMVVNILGSFLMGVLIGWLSLKLDGSDNFKLFLATGFLGGFTTFSAFSLDAFMLLEKKEFGALMAYITGSVFIAIAALMLGLWISRKVFA